jgi:hypothetical protein
LIEMPKTPDTVREVKLALTCAELTLPVWPAASVGAVAAASEYVALPVKLPTTPAPVGVVTS